MGVEGEHWCPLCGDHDHSLPEVEAAAEVDVAAEVTSAEVEIERIRAQKEISLAKIQAGTFRDEVVVEAAVEAAHAEGEADGLREALTPPEPVVEEAPAPVVINDVSDVDIAPEVQEPPEHDEAPPSKPRKRGLLQSW